MRDKNWFKKDKLWFSWTKRVESFCIRFVSHPSFPGWACSLLMRKRGATKLSDLYIQSVSFVILAPITCGASCFILTTSVLLAFNLDLPRQMSGRSYFSVHVEACEAASAKIEEAQRCRKSSVVPLITRTIVLLDGCVIGTYCVEPILRVILESRGSHARISKVDREAPETQVLF
jgi:hypothetical protein